MSQSSEYITQDRQCTLDKVRGGPKEKAEYTALRCQDYLSQRDLYRAIKKTVERLSKDKPGDQQVTRRIKAEFEGEWESYALYYDATTRKNFVSITVYHKATPGDNEIHLSSIPYGARFTWDSLKEEIARWEFTEKLNGNLAEQRELIPALEDIYQEMRALRQKAIDLFKGTEEGEPMYDIQKCYPFLSSLFNL